MTKYTLRDLTNLITNFDVLYAEYKLYPIDVPAYLVTDPSKPVTESRLVKHTNIYDDFIKRDDALDQSDRDAADDYLAWVDRCNQYIGQKLGDEATFWCPYCWGFCGGECRMENGELNGGTP